MSVETEARRVTFIGQLVAVRSRRAPRQGRRGWLAHQGRLEQRVTEK